MKAIKIKQSQWIVVDLDKPHLKPKFLSDNPYRYWHYPIIECDIGFREFWKRITNHNGMGKRLREYGLSSHHRNYFDKWNTRGRGGNLILQQIDDVKHGLTFNKLICNPNKNTPGFNVEDVFDMKLILDPQKRNGENVVWSLDKILKNIIINLLDGDENGIG